MSQFKYILIIVFIIINSSCVKQEEKISNIKEKSQELEMIEAYNEAYNQLNQNNPYIAAKKFL